MAAKLRIAELDSERMRLLEQITDATEKAESRPKPTPALDVGAILADLPDLRPVLATYTDTELADLFDAFDLNMRVHTRPGCSPSPRDSPTAYKQSDRPEAVALMGL